MEILEKAKFASGKIFDEFIHQSIHGHELIKRQISNLTLSPDIDPYDNLSVIQLKNRIHNLHTRDLRKIRSHELLNKRRRSVIHLVTNELNYQIYNGG